SRCSWSSRVRPTIFLRSRRSSRCSAMSASSRARRSPTVSDTASGLPPGRTLPAGGVSLACHAPSRTGVRQGTPAMEHEHPAYTERRGVRNGLEASPEEPAYWRPVGSRGIRPVAFSCRGVPRRGPGYHCSRHPRRHHPRLRSRCCDHVGAPGPQDVRPTLARRRQGRDRALMARALQGFMLLFATLLVFDAAREVATASGAFIVHRLMYLVLA